MGAMLPIFIRATRSPLTCRIKSFNIAYIFSLLLEGLLVSMEDLHQLEQPDVQRGVIPRIIQAQISLDLAVQVTVGQEVTQQIDLLVLVPIDHLVGKI